MILMALALAAQPLWTGPRTVEYIGPGNYCGGGYAVALAPGDRALVLPQGQAPQATRLIIGGREVNIHTGIRGTAGRVVLRVPGNEIMEINDDHGITYLVVDQTSYALSVTSNAFRGYKNDRWFFRHANFAARADETVPCLAGRSY